MAIRTRKGGCQRKSGTGTPNHRVNHALRSAKVDPAPTIMRRAQRLLRGVLLLLLLRGKALLVLWGVLLLLRRVLRRVLLLLRIRLLLRVLLLLLLRELRIIWRGLKLLGRVPRR